MKLRRKGTKKFRIFVLMEKELSSPLLEKAVTALSLLPGIGRKSALRLALHLLRRPEGEALEIADAIARLRSEVRYCRVCHNISDEEICPICASPKRRHSAVCVVESIRDVMSIESTGQFDGVYHVLGGLISPVDGIGPDVLEIDSLVSRVAEQDIEEVILALSATMEGDTTNYYIFRRLSSITAQRPNLRITQLARGVSVGNELEYTDEVTLARSLLNRTPYETSF